jgi:hypothetical protein
MYLPEADAWIPRPPLPEARFRFDAAHVTTPSGAHVLVFGGHPTCTVEPNDPAAIGRCVFFVFGCCFPPLSGRPAGHCLACASCALRLFFSASLCFAP